MVAVSKYSLAYWLFHVITFERKVFSKIHELKIKKSLNESCTYFTWNVETNNVDAKVVTDTQTDRQTDIQTHKTSTVTLLRMHAEG